MAWGVAETMKKGQHRLHDDAQHHIFMDVVAWFVGQYRLNLVNLKIVEKRIT